MARALFRHVGKKSTVHSRQFRVRAEKRLDYQLSTLNFRLSTFDSQLSTSLQSFFGELESAEDGAGLVHALVVFAGGDGIGDDAGAGLQVGNFIFD
jgi:hypothetical protein